VSVDVRGLCLLVPSAPRGLQLSVIQDEPPVISALWQIPRQTHGHLTAYRLRYRVVDDDQLQAEVRQLDAEKYRFTTGFLGQFDYLLFIYYIIIHRVQISTYTEPA